MLFTAFLRNNSVLLTFFLQRSCLWPWGSHLAPLCFHYVLTRIIFIKTTHIIHEKYKTNNMYPLFLLTYALVDIPCCNQCFQNSTWGKRKDVMNSLSHHCHWSWVLCQLHHAFHNSTRQLVLQNARCTLQHRSVSAQSPVCLSFKMSFDISEWAAFVLLNVVQILLLYSL